MLRLLLLGLSLTSCSPFGQKTSTSVTAPTVAGENASGESVTSNRATAEPAPTDQTADQPSLPGGSVVMGNDPHGTTKMTGEAQAELLCKDTDKGTTQVRLTGGLKDVEEMEGGTKGVLRIFNNKSEKIDLRLDETYRFSQTFLAHAPLSLEFKPYFYAPDASFVVFEGLSTPPVPDEIPTMVACAEACTDVMWKPVDLLFTNPEAEPSLPVCGTPEGEADASLVCQDTGKGTIQVRVSGQLRNVNERTYPKDRLYVRIFNAGATPELYDVHVDDQYRFSATFEAHAPVRFEFGIRVLEPGMHLFYTRPGQTPSMFSCSAETCLSSEGVDRMTVKLEGNLVPESSLAACAPPASTIITVQP
jgi:hypothetical protein